jgi:cytoskeletal protein CcmA (bactofilin family)
MSNTEKQTLVEEGTEFSGKLKSKCKVVVRGAVDGDLEAPSVDVTETGEVTGNVKAQSVRSSGVLAGRVDADDITLAGEVRSNTVIKAKSLEVKLAAQEGKLEVTFGDCVLDVGDLPAKEKIDAPSDDETADTEEAAQAEGSGSDGRRRKRRRGRKNNEDVVEAGGDERANDEATAAEGGSEPEAPASSPPAE